MITYVKGDATRPQFDGQAIIVHVCNDAGRWGAGFSGAISSRWKAPEKEYREWWGRCIRELPLGGVQYVRVTDRIVVANLIGQHGVRSKSNPTPVRYDAIWTGLEHIAKDLASRSRFVEVCMPRIGCGLAGGDWSEIEPLIVGTLSARGIRVTVYDL